MSKINQEEKELLEDKIQSEGFDYTFLEYSNWGTIDDDKFHILRQSFIRSRNSLMTYVKSTMDIDIE